MSVPAAFFGVVLIWATTPLAIKWSSESAGFLFGVTARMVLGVVLCLLLVALMSRRMRWHRRAMATYLTAGCGIWGSMTSVYWAAQFMPSGLISVLFGLTPIVTALMAALWLGERALTPARVLGIALGVLGLALVFMPSSEVGEQAHKGMFAILLAVVIHAVSSVWTKRLNPGLHPLETTTGALLVAVPLFLLSWGGFDGQLPIGLTPRAAWSIVYLAVFGSALGFILYYYVLHKIQASQTSLITLLTPMAALAIGHSVNGEVLSLHTWVGSGIVLLGLACFEWGGGWLARLAGDQRASRLDLDP